MSLPAVAIVGRPNVGKSTLFNRIMGRRIALVDETAGVTRDRHYGEATWLNRAFRLIDTGGMLLEELSDLMQAVHEQVVYAIAEADLVLFVIDARAGVTTADQDVALRLHKAGKDVVLTANKVETDEIGFGDAPWYRLGFGEPFRISAEHGRGIGDLLDAVVAKLPKTTASQGALTGVQVAIVGRPNVGKSSLVNRILGEERLLVDATPGTTRDAIDSRVRVNKKSYTLIDTAGMRKPRRIAESLEKVTVSVSLKRIQRCEVAVLMLDAEVDVGEQDVRIASYIERQGKACVISVNKWDAIEKETSTYTAFVQRIHAAMPFWAHAPIISMSALTGQRVIKLFPLIDRVLEETNRRIPVAALNAFLKTATRQRTPPMYRGKFVKFSFMTQTLVQPPTFLCFVNRPEGVAQPYQRYLGNQLRQHFGLAGTPIRIHFRKK
ncbi:MAG: ribosome biogenesis GTPase Der [Candidatus Tectomicrobia bacterium]